MKRLLASLVFLSLAAVASAQQVSTHIRPGDPIRAPRPNQAPPITNPEPMTLVALAGGAAVAGGLLRRRKQRQGA